MTRAKAVIASYVGVVVFAAPLFLAAGRLAYGPGLLSSASPSESLWAFVPVAVGAAILVARTALEDRFLRARLPGYPEYAARTRWRLVPGVF